LRESRQTSFMIATLSKSTFLDVLRESTQMCYEQSAFTFLRYAGKKVSSAVSVSYGDLDLAAKAIAAKLQSLDLVGERALLLYPPGLEFVSAFLGCLYAGVIAVPAYPPRRNQKLSRLQSIVSDAQAKIVLTVEAQLQEMQSRFIDSLDIVDLQWLATNTVTTQWANQWQAPQITADSIAFLQYTSGSTGTPKGVMVSHGNLLHNEKAIWEGFGHIQRKQGIGWLPLFHDMGLVGNILQPLYGGYSCILMSPLDFIQQPIRWLQAISDYKGTISGGPNFAYNICTQKVNPDDIASLDLSSWDLAFCGSEPIRAETLKQFAKKFAPCGFRKEAFFPCYGMAETTLIVSGGINGAQSPPIVEVDTESLAQNLVVRSQTKEPSTTRSMVGCGSVHPELKVLIVDPNTKLLCSPDRVGEIWVAGPSVAQGYWRQPTATAQTFQSQLASGEGSFLRTGDVGFLLEGELFVTGRLKDIIIIRGRNYYPQDIELTVEQCHPGLRPSCGAAFVTEIQGEEKLAIVQEVERSYLRRLDKKEVVGDIRQTLATEHGLQAAAIVLVKPGTIPKTSSGKIQRYACCSAFLKGNLTDID